MKKIAIPGISVFVISHSVFADETEVRDVATIEKELSAKQAELDQKSQAASDAAKKSMTETSPVRMSYDATAKETADRLATAKLQLEERMLSIRLDTFMLSHKLDHLAQDIDASNPGTNAMYSASAAKAFTAPAMPGDADAKELIKKDSKPDNF